MQNLLSGKCNCAGARWTGGGGAAKNCRRVQRREFAFLSRRHIFTVMTMEDIRRHLEVILGMRVDGDMTESLAALDGAAETDAIELDSHLRHYLRKRSYAKAHAFLTQSEG